MSRLPAPLPLTLTRTVWRLDLWLDGAWAPQCYLPSATIAADQMSRLAQSLAGAGYAVRATPVDDDGAAYRWPDGGVRAVREVVPE